jgi:prepilin-type N-terminal cleavage/methylation domain-containing protein
LPVTHHASRTRRARAPSRQVTHRAFSLIEILVVIALMSVIILGLLAMFNQTQRAFRTGMTQVDVLEAGRAATEMIARELSQITPANYSRDAVTFSAGIYSYLPPFQPVAPLLQPLPGTKNPPDLRMNLLEGMFFLMQENQTGQPRWSGIGYWVGNPATGASPTEGWGTLYRFQANTMFGAFPFPSLLYSNYYRLDARKNLSSRIIDGVVHFKVRAYDTNGVLITKSLKANTAVYTNVVGEVEFCRFTNSAVPAFVEFELGVLEERALARVKSIPDATTRSNYLAQQAGRVHLFRMRVPVRNVDPTAYQ